MQAKVDMVIQIILLFLIQWLSIAVIVLNALALHSAKDLNQGLIMAAETGLQDFVLLVMAAASLFIVSLFLCVYLQMFFRHPTGPSMKTSKTILVTEVVCSIFIIALWTSATSVLLSMFHELSTCKHQGSSLINNVSKLSSRACSLANAMMIVAFVAVSIWFLVLLGCLYSLARVCGFCFKAPESISIHPTGDKWLESEPIPTEAMYTEDMQAVGKVTKSVRNDQRTFSSKYEIPTTSSSTIQKSSSSSNDMIVVEYPDVLQTKLKDFNFDFTPMDFP
ncbi:uncharacterized protein EV154DRAFT_549803 [Mucor mucedo]|uniref:uncharacterized protein n=1 Tax=Mucor mucedo TaxID=29922 RepID=UPI00222080B6|nr:uncharacterized protein EV154DRAFT_549803 [Mucor mucedo]KAI7893466.1 hypothetical protein EV154DRAFT_549803 [Mucor mucedo]